MPFRLPRRSTLIAALLPAPAGTASAASFDIIESSVNAPFGLASSDDDDWVGRYHATDSERQTININPTPGFQATDHVSPGFGVDYQGET